MPNITRQALEEMERDELEARNDYWLEFENQLIKDQSDEIMIFNKSAEKKLSDSEKERMHKHISKEIRLHGLHKDIRYLIDLYGDQLKPIIELDFTIKG